jgi:hypothetical protein
MKSIIEYQGGIMKKLLVILFVVFSFLGCNNEDKELKKLQIENEKEKTEIQKLEKEKLLQSFKQQYKLAESEMYSIGLFIESHITDWSKTPEEDSLERMSMNEEYKLYIKKIPLIDPWGNKYVFSKIPEKIDEYILYSSGSDGIFKGLDQPTDQLWDIGSDIIFKNGEFTVGLTKSNKLQNK